MRIDSRLDSATSALDPPFAVADLDAFQHNAADLLRRSAQRPVRVATKSVRCVELLRRALAIPGFAGLMCYSLDEALWLHDLGISEDLLVAYPPVSASALRSLTAHREAADAVAITVDSVEHLDRIDAVTGPDRPVIRVCLEIDMSWRPLGAFGPHIGVRRSPLRSVEDVRRITREILRRPGFRLVGLLLYEAQIAGLGDAPARRPLYGSVVRAIQNRSAQEIAQRRSAVVRAVEALTPLEFVNGGGTGSLERTAEESAVTELAAGSGLIGPTLFDHYRTFQPRPAVLYALPVVHRPGKRIATVFGGGYPASGVPDEQRLPAPHWPAGLRLTSAEGAGEVQTPVVGTAASRLRLGDRVWFRHAKAGEPAERFTHYHLIEDGQVVEVAPTYRGAGKSFG